MSNIEAPEMLSVVRGCLLGIGYQEDLLLTDYKFRDFLKETNSFDGESSAIELAAFAQSPPSYRSACIGITVPRDESSQPIARFRALGTPQILALYPKRQVARRWKIPAAGDPEHLDEFSFDTLASKFQQKREEWSPQRILSAKTLAFVEGAAQLDFMDLGLLPALEAELRPKLNLDIQNIIVCCRNVYEQWYVGGNFDSILAPLFRLIFRLIAAKMLIDREDKPEWLDMDAVSVIREVEAFYFPNEQAEQALEDIPIQTAAWEQIRTGLSLQNLSSETLAYVYENAFVTQEVRQRLSVHATPQEIAEYIVRQLPIKQIDWQKRIVFEPFTGAAPFLTAALGRLRELLPENLSATDRHAYFVEMLCGLESDPFSREIARYSLILADYPNPNGWRVDVADAFRDPRFDQYLQLAKIVLCNPPHEDFPLEERNSLPSEASVNKGAEALRRILKHPPAMLGFVLPRSFLGRSAFRQLRQDVVAKYRNVSVTVLPDKTFRLASQEVALIIADNVGRQDQPYSYASVTSAGYSAFLRTGEPTYKESYSVPDRRNDDVILWRTPLQSVWDALENCSTLSSLAEIHVGVHYESGQLSACISNEPKTDFIEGVASVNGYLEPYLFRDYQYLCSRPDVMRDNAYKLPWDRPKVLVNRGRLSRGYWHIAGAIDETGLMVGRQFYGVWPRDDTSIELLAAIISGPVGNAYLSGFPEKRDNRIKWINQIPVPQFTREQMELIVSLAQEYGSQRGQWIAEPQRGDHYEGRCRELLYQIDAAVLEAYALPADLERVLLDRFDELERRPLPFRFSGYGEEYGRAKEALQKEKVYRALLKQYHALVDKKYLSALTTTESEELERMRQGIDDYNTPFYKPILQALSANDH